MAFKRLQRLPPVRRGLDLCPAILQQLFDDFGVQRVVLGQQDAQAAHIRRLRLPCRLLRFGQFLGDFKGQGNHKFRTLALPAAHLDAAAHLINQALDDGHAQPRPVIDAPRVGVLLRERVKDVRQKRPAHADARVADHPAIGDDSIPLADVLAKRRHAAADLVVFDAVAVDVQKHLPQVQRAPVYAVGLHPLELPPVIFKRNARLGGALLHDGQNIAQKAVQIERLVRQRDFAAFQLAHLQHIVDEAEQMVGRHLHLLPVRGQQRDVARVRVVDLQQTDDPVQRRSNVVAHAGKEAGLGRVGAIRLIHGGAQLGVRGAQLLRVFLLHAILPLLIALRRPKANRLGEREDDGIENQREQHALRGRCKHRLFRHIHIDVKIPPAPHHAVIPPKRILRPACAHQLTAAVRLTNLPQNRHFLRVAADERLVVAGHDPAAAGDDNRAARFRAVPRKHQRDGQPKRIEIFHRRSVIRRDDARRIPPPDGGQINHAPVRAGKARGVALFGVKRRVQQRGGIQIFAKLPGRFARPVIIRQNEPRLIHHNQPGDISHLRILRKRCAFFAVRRHLTGNMADALHHAHQALGLAGQLNAVVAVALFLDVSNGRRHLLPRGNRVRMGRRQKHDAQQRQRQQNFHVDEANGKPVSF